MGIPGRGTRREKVQSHDLLKKQWIHLCGVDARGAGPAEGRGKAAQAEATKFKVTVSSGGGDEGQWRN